MEIAPGVYTISIGQGAFTGVFPPNVYLVAGEHPVLLDSGYEADAPTRLGKLRELGLGVGRILLSHPHVDHIGGAGPIGQATGARICIHRDDAAEAGDIAEALEHGQVISTGNTDLEVVHTPGHTPGHMCLLLRPQGFLFSGDHVLGLGTTVITPPRGDMGRYMASLENLLTYPFQSILPGHGPMVQDGHSKVAELLQHRREREAQVLSCLERGHNLIADMVKDIYDELDPRLMGLAELQVKAHLAKLQTEGRISVQEGAYHLE
ncbi:MAG: MBL fold metallo-hydrolase [Dehalococcoidia bacterium]|jgi:glyoxylase-like metal-dependent hydrolase (beta-lactamase superfamily II)|nr:MBL fold metallo-hydrolase [Dehalococcoidia bacterium]MDP7239747.1 MBL fold metallo-hydrolase [Dehalococcoidia bacterium]MDP7470504.1 MBL fold metallo-hydrolase [Dehalococcoidia bacterium]